MFELLFSHTPTVFSKGEFVLLGRWPAWVLLLAVAAVAGALGFAAWRRRAEFSSGVRGWRSAGVWLLQTLSVALILLLLWQPALLVSTLKPQQNVVAVVVDDSRSMAIAESGVSRREQVVKALEGGVLEALGEKFQVRLYRLGEGLERIEKTQELASASQSTRIGENLQRVAEESASLPIGAVVLMSDGADNAGGIDLETIAAVRQRKIPVHTVGFGREKFERDIEISDVQLPPRALADSRLRALVTFRQTGYTKQKARLTLRESGKVLATQEVTLQAEGTQQTEAVAFNAGIAGAKHLQVSIDALQGEENPSNNTVTRLVNVEGSKPRILYIEGEPRWEFKFIRRAIEDDRSLQLVSMLRTTQNKIYRQGIANSKELEEGFPAKVEELFDYQGLIIGGVELAYFTPAQQDLIRHFVDRRGGGLLFLSGRSALSEGGYSTSSLAELLPVSLPDRKGTFHRDPATIELSPQGRDSLICRLEEDAAANAERWKKLPYLADYQEVGQPKPGAVVLAELLPTSKGRSPFLVTQNYGRGRTAVLAGGTWRWQMQQPLEDRSHEMFWQQLLRWLVADTPGRVVASMPKQVLSDEKRVPLRAIVRDKTYLPAVDAQVEARILGPEGLSEIVNLHPDPLEQGLYSSEWRAEKPGSYLAEVMVKRGEEEVGRDVLTFRREDGVAESFRAEQNRELLEKLSEQTGGRYYRPEELRKLAGEISYSEAGITVRETKDLWSMPIIFLILAALRGGEWLLRRKWGVV